MRPHTKQGERYVWHPQGVTVQDQVQRKRFVRTISMKGLEECAGSDECSRRVMDHESA